MPVRAKFTCTSVTKSQNYSGSNRAEHPFVYDYSFQAVTGNSEENKSFFSSTPQGSVKLQAVKDDLFEPGKDYYLDFTPAA